MECSTSGQISKKVSVKERKDRVLKTTLQVLIRERGMSEPEFFRKLQMSRQRWYSYSWGLWPMPDYLKIKIANVLGVDSSVIFQNLGEKVKMNSIEHMGDCDQCLKSFPKEDLHSLNNDTLWLCPGCYEGEK